MIFVCSGKSCVGPEYPCDDREGAVTLCVGGKRTFIFSGKWSTCNNKRCYYIVSDRTRCGAWENTTPVNYSRNGFSEHELSWLARMIWF